MGLSRKDWISGKLAIADRLNKGECGGGYGEAALIVCSAISAMAAEVWPGDRIDRKRFVEAIVTHGNLSQTFLRISVPLLLSSCLNTPATRGITGLQEHFSKIQPGLIVTGDETDMAEQKVAQLCPALTLKEIRKYSYPNILYQEVRSGYVHQYQPGPQADSWQMTRRQESRSATQTRRVLLTGKSTSICIRYVPLRVQ